MNTTEKQGLFSCLSIALKILVDEYNRTKQLPQKINDHNLVLFSMYGASKEKNLCGEYLSPSKIPESDKYEEIKFEFEYQFAKYSDLDFKNYKKFVNSYFRASDKVVSGMENIEKKYEIDHDNTIVLFYRGNDKSKECYGVPYLDYVEHALNLKKNNPDCRFLVQSDETEFIETMRNLFPDSIVFDDEIRHIRRRRFTVDNLGDRKEAFDYSLSFLSIILIMSRCKYIITNSSNCSLWMCLYRGNANNVYQCVTKNMYDDNISDATWYINRISLSRSVELGPKHPLLVVNMYSGLCNRLTVLLCVMRHLSKYPRKCLINWRPPSSRVNLKYFQENPGESNISDFFKHMPFIDMFLMSMNNTDYIKMNHSVVMESTRLRPQTQPIFLPSPKTTHDYEVIDEVTIPFLCSGMDDNEKIRAPYNSYSMYPDTPGLVKACGYERELMVLARQFVPTDDIGEIIAREENRIFGNSSKKRFGIHIRSTDFYLGEDRVKDIQREISKRIEKEKEKSVIFLCSDDDSITYYFAKHYPENVFQYGEPRKSENSFYGVRHSLVDLYLLSKCNHILGSPGSSYSYMSWLLSSEGTVFELRRDKPQQIQRK